MQDHGVNGFATKTVRCELIICVGAWNAPYGIKVIRVGALLSSMSKSSARTKFRSAPGNGAQADDIECYGNLDVIMAPQNNLAFLKNKDQ